jgi:hypothetical protein
MVAVAVAAGGSTAFAAPANTATGPTVTVQGGVAIVTGTAVRDRLTMRTDANELIVDFGSDGTVDARIPQSRFQQVRVLAGGGDDGVIATGAGQVPVTINGEAGNDFIGVSNDVNVPDPKVSPTTISGDDGNDILSAYSSGPVTILAGAGDDRVDGTGPGAGQQSVSLGDGNDRYQSLLPNTRVGPRQDSVDGGAGQDILDMAGAFADEGVTLSARDGHLVVNYELRDRVVAANVEDVTYIGFGGSDVGDGFGVNDLSGTGVARVTANFSAGQNEPNNSFDVMTVRGTPGVDHIAVSGQNGTVVVSGLGAVVSGVFLRSDDLLDIDTLAGDDVVDSSALQPGVVQLRTR